MVKIFISGYYGLNNIGDEAILSGMINCLNAHFYEPEYYVLTNNANVTYTLHKVHTVEQSLKKGNTTFLKNIVIKNEIGNILKQIRNCDIFILGGGSLLQDLKAHYLPILLSQIKIAQKLRKKTVIYGIGAGPIDTKLGKYLCRSILNYADLITVRDTMSKEVLEECGVHDVIQTADPAFGIPIPELNVVNPIDGKGTGWANYCIGITAYNWLHDSDKYRNLNHGTADLHDRRRKLANIFDTLVNEKNCSLNFIPTVKIDYEGYNEIQKLMSFHQNSRVLEFTNDFKRVFCNLSQSDLLIGMRLHSLIFASLLGKPVIPISYCGKVRSYLDLIGIPELYLDIENLCEQSFSNTFFNNFNKVMENMAHYREIQKRSSQRLRLKAFENAELVAKIGG